jgi:uncharacterized protein RhaS with RHS repeats
VTGSGAWLDDEICLVSYAYDEQRQLVCVTGRGGSVRRRFRWQDGLMSAHEDANGLLSEYRWRRLTACRAWSASATAAANS